MLALLWFMILFADIEAVIAEEAPEALAEAVASVEAEAASAAEVAVATPVEDTASKRMYLMII